MVTKSFERCHERITEGEEGTAQLVNDALLHLVLQWDAFPADATEDEKEEIAKARIALFNEARPWARTLNFKFKSYKQYRKEFEGGE